MAGWDTGVDQVSHWSMETGHGGGCCCGLCGAPSHVGTSVAGHGPAERDSSFAFNSTLETHADSLDPSAAGSRSGWFSSELEQDGQTLVVDWLVGDEAALLQGVTATTPDLATAAAGTLQDPFRLHSRPGAAHTIYLDFDGHVARGTAWNRSHGRDSLVSEAWSLDANRGRFSSAERAAIQRIWAAVAEDFAPFDVNVTTEDPGVEALQRTSSRDTRWGVRVAIGTDPGVAPNALGIAYIDSFSWNEDAPVYVFAQTEAGVALAASHEVGHALGLRHDGAGSSSYYGGHGDWGPIMGNPFGRSLTQWSDGSYAGATNREDDLEIIAAENGFGFAADDYGDDAEHAQSWSPSTTGSLPELAGVISSSNDVDAFRFQAAAGRIDLQARVLDFGANLDVRLELQDLQGRTLAVSSPSDQLDAAITTNLRRAGTYVLLVSGAGQSGSRGYSSYGSLGHYWLEGQVQPVRSQSADAPTRAPSVANNTAASPDSETSSTDDRSSSATTSGTTTASTSGPAEGASASGSSKSATAPKSTDAASSASNQARRTTRTYTSNRSISIGSGRPSTVVTSLRIPSLPGRVADVNVRVDLSHTWVGDLTLTLIAPGGQRIPLARQRGGNGDHYASTWFDDQASQPIVSAGAPFAGRYRPESPLSALQGRVAAGVWKLEVRDNAFLDGGQLHGWSLQMTTREPGAADAIIAETVLARPFSAPANREDPTAPHARRPSHGPTAAERRPSSSSVDGVPVDHPLHAPPPANDPDSADTGEVMRRLRHRLRQLSVTDLPHEGHLAAHIEALDELFANW